MARNSRETSRSYSCAVSSAFSPAHYSHDVDANANGRDDHHGGRIDVKVVLDQPRHGEIAQERGQQPNAENRQDSAHYLSTFVAEGHAMVGRPLRHPYRNQRDDETDTIGQQMGGVGHYCEAAGYVAANNFGDLQGQRVLDIDQQTNMLV